MYRSIDKQGLYKVKKKEKGNKILIIARVAIDTTTNDNILRQMYIVFLVSFIVNCYLRSSWILDNGSGIQLYNDIIEYRFKNNRKNLDS